ncbi:MAG: ABC transporter permease [Planctomycetota bacterium]
MKPIEAKNQAKLSWARCGRLALSGMSYRMLRSGITTAILALAVAFLVYTAVYGILAERTRTAAWDELRPTRDAVRRLSRLTTPDTLASIRQQLAAADPADLGELRGWYGGDDERWEQARHGARALAQTHRWFAELSPAATAVLLGGRDLAALLEEIGTADDSTAYLDFVERVNGLGLGPSWTRHASEAGDTTVARWAVLQDVARDVQDGHGRAVETLRKSHDQPLSERLDDAAGAEPVRQAIHDAGFVLDDAAWRGLVDYARYSNRVAAARAALLGPEVRQQAQRRWGTDTLEGAMRALRNEDQAAWWSAEVGDTFAPLSARQVAQRYLREARHDAVAEGYRPAAETAAMGLSTGTLWLVGLSLLVCVVGVTNALLMSVTERFNEIATMKCLGAMDGSIMRVFVIEALVQGAAGGAVGVLLGVLLALGRGGLEFGGTLGLAADATGRVLTAAAVSLGVGVLLATLAAIGPAWVASRLSPMEAMRVE